MRSSSGPNVSRLRAHLSKRISPRAASRSKFPTHFASIPGLNIPTAGSGRQWSRSSPAGRTAKPIAIHRTFLKKDGTGKAPVPRQKMMLGPCAGGAVRLAEAGERIAVGEGIETCLSVLQEAELPGMGGAVDLWA